MEIFANIITTPDISTRVDPVIAAHTTHLMQYMALCDVVQFFTIAFDYILVQLLQGFPQTTLTPSFQVRDIFEIKLCLITWSIFVNFPKQLAFERNLTAFDLLIFIRVFKRNAIFPQPDLAWKVLGGIIFIKLFNIL